MTVSGRVNDPLKKTIIQGAIVSIVDSVGQEKNLSTITNDVGAFNISNAGIVIGDKIRVSHPDYKTLEIPVTGQRDYGFVSMVINDPVAEKPATTAPENKNNTWLIVGGLAAALLFAAANKKKKKVAGIDKTAIIVISGLALAFYVVGKKEDSPIDENVISDLPALLPEQAPAPVEAAIKPSDYDIFNPAQ